MRHLKIGLWLLVVCLLVAAAPVWAQTTISTDGDVEAQGFIGDGSQVTEVDAQLLDGMDSAAFAHESDLTSAEAMLVALQAQVDALGLALVPRTGELPADASVAVVALTRSRDAMTDTADPPKLLGVQV